jgi:hypothetical protein
MDRGEGCRSSSHRASRSEPEEKAADMNLLDPNVLHRMSVRAIPSQEGGVLWIEMKLNRQAEAYLFCT